MTRPFDFSGMLRERSVDLTPLPLATLQLNVTKLCNQTCVHCHVDAGPRRRESMPRDVLEQCLAILAKTDSIENLDITGGAPELHPDFRELVTRARQLGKHVMVRHNLTVTLDPHPRTLESMAYLPDFFTEHRVEVISSLPYYQEFFTDKQRGSGVFQKSMTSLKLLNDKGFGVPGTGLALNLVYNPVGAFLPAAQADLERDYKKELFSRFGIQFNQLFAIANLPIHRFKAQLLKAGGYEAYMEKLMAAFNPKAAEGVMCRNVLSVAWDGKLYDCDFNQMLAMQIDHQGQGATVFDFDAAALATRTIKVGPHCFGCTAGAGSSCGGATT